MSAPGKQPKRGNPFLRRSWNASVARTSKDMTMTTPKRNTPRKQRRPNADDDDDANDDDFVSTSKSTRLAAADAVSGMRLRQADRSGGGGGGGGGGDGDRTGNAPGAIATATSNPSRPTCKRPFDSKAEPHSLRIILKEIVHGTKRHRTTSAADFAGKETVRTKALCTVTITCSADSQQQQQSTTTMVRHRESQLCTIETLRDAKGQLSFATVALARPFLVVRESLLVNRGDSLQFADTYELAIEIEAGEGAWPPFKPADFAVASGSHFATVTRRWVLRARIVDIFRKPRNSAKLALVQHGTDHHAGTDHYLTVDIAWASPASPTVEAEPSSAVAARGEGPDPLRHVNGQMNGEPAGVPEQGPDLASRSRRARQNTTTTTTTTTTIPPKPIENGTSNPQPSASNALVPLATPDTSTRVSYRFPALVVVLDAFSCVVCGPTHPSKMHLQAHLQMNHEQFEFEMRDDDEGDEGDEGERAGKGLVCIVRHRTDDDPDVAKPDFSRVDSHGALDLKRIAAGDLSSIMGSVPAEAKEKKAKEEELREEPEEEKPKESRVEKSTEKASTENSNAKNLEKPKPAQPLKHIPPLVPIDAIKKSRIHLSWLLQADVSAIAGPVLRSTDGSLAELTYCWDLFVAAESPRFVAPLSLQFEFTRFLRSKTPAIRASPRLLRAFRTQLKLLMDNRGMDAAYGSVLLEMLDAIEAGVGGDVAGDGNGVEEIVREKSGGRPPAQGTLAKSETQQTSSGQLSSLSTTPSGFFTTTTTTTNSTSTLRRPIPKLPLTHTLLKKRSTLTPATHATPRTFSAAAAAAAAADPYEMLNDEQDSAVAPLSMPERRKRARGVLDHDHDDGGGAGGYPLDTEPPRRAGGTTTPGSVVSVASSSASTTSPSVGGTTTPGGGDPPHKRKKGRPRKYPPPGEAGQGSGLGH